LLTGAAPHLGVIVAMQFALRRQAKNALNYRFLSTAATTNQNTFLSSW
jgi:hypothetical protein